MDPKTLFVVGLAIVLSGCVSASAQQLGDVEKPGHDRIGDAVALTHDVGIKTNEPTIGVTKSGSVFFNGGRVAVRYPPILVRSQDDGKTWTDVSPPLPIARGNWSISRRCKNGSKT